MTSTMFFGVPTLYAAMLADKSLHARNRLRPAGKMPVRRRGIAGRGVVDAGRSASASRSGTASARPRCCTSSCPTGRTATSAAPPATPCPATTLKLVDEQGSELGQGEIGELLVSGASCCNGYWNKREKTRSTFEGKWARTGDKYIRDEDGFYQYCGRTDDMFKVSGIWVSPFEVESALVSHESVLECAVVAHEDDEGLVKPKAFVVLNDGFGQDGLFDMLKEHVKAQAGPWKYPRWIEFVPDLPKTATGKIQRFKLRA